MKAHRTASWAGALAALALVATACGGGSEVEAGPTPTLTKPPIKIGNVGSYSGFAGTTSKASVDAVRAWAKQTNAAGGINGHPVEVVVRDDQSQAPKAIAAVKDLVENEKVIAIVGQHEAGLEGSWASYVSAMKIPVIGGNASGAVWLTNPNFFPTTLTTLNYLTITANTTRVAGKSAYGIVFCAEVPGCAEAVPATRGVAQKLGIRFVGGQALSASAPSYAAQCIALRKSGADTIFVATAQETGLRFSADCAKQGYRPTLLQSGQSWSEDQLKNTATDGLWIASDSALWVGDSAPVKQYREAMEKYAPDSLLNGSGTAGWTGAVVFGKALANISAQPTSEDVYKGLYALGPNYSADGMIPPVTFAKDKPAVQKPCGWYAQVKGGDLTTPKGAGQICVGG
ncbi:ABC transporter substrate-binding protein [Actinomadura sp. SCN-SB]|uniref:ABC transporter substrate-binding protein n=1 Tax=Actinomadura sp. SCN-SB TaxID=3373092 RepID=UPI003751D6B3